MTSSAKHSFTEWSGPSVVVDNTLDRQFNVEDLDKVRVTNITYIRALEGFA